MDKQIQSKVVVITGASSGLGAATGRFLAARGAKVVLGARRTGRIEQLASEIVAAGGEAIAIEVDVTRMDLVQTMVDRAVEQFGRVDVMLNNAGVAPLSMLESLQVEDWIQTIDVNLKGVMHGVAAALPVMKEQRSGQFINVASIAAFSVGPSTAVYSATKQAVRVFTEGLRQEVKPYGIRTAIISPGAIATDLPSGTTDADIAAGIRKFYESALPPESFARAVAFAMSQPDDMDVNEIVFRPTYQTV